MKNKIKYFITFLIFVCCTANQDQEALVEQIINESQDIKNICKNSSFQLSDVLKKSLEQHENIYIEHFKKFNKKFKYSNRYNGQAKDHALISVFITTENDSFLTEFQFKQKGQEKILHNIVLPGF